MTTKTNSLSELERAIGYRFTSKELLEAVTHKSFVHESGRQRQGQPEARVLRGRRTRLLSAQNFSKLSESGEGCPR
jgi:dsRNA-specific ribonuclease